MLSWIWTSDLILSPPPHPPPKVSVSDLRNPQTALDTPACRVPSVVPASATTGRAATAPQVSFSSPSSFCRGLLDKGTGLRFHLTSFWGCGQCKETGSDLFSYAHPTRGRQASQENKEDIFQTHDNILLVSQLECVRYLRLSHLPVGGWGCSDWLELIRGCSQR